MKGRAVIALAAVAAIAALCLPGISSEEEKLPTKASKGCLKCHNYDKQFNLFAGNFVDVSAKAKTIQLKIDGESEIIYFNDATVEFDKDQKGKYTISD